MILSISCRYRLSTGLGSWRQRVPSHLVTQKSTIHFSLCESRSGAWCISHARRRKNRVRQHLFILAALLIAALPAKAQTLLPVSFAHAAPMWSQARDVIADSVGCMREASHACAAASAMVQQLGGADFISQLDSVNRYINRHSYVSDSQLWDRDDYWADTSEFFEVGGDCEDFAIAKYAMLRALGVPAEAMQIIVGRNQITGEIHAWLAVRTTAGTIFLDNQDSRLVPAIRATHLLVQVAVNEHGLWRSPAQPLVPAAAASR
jgi:predicted transglutaminase-like cysteine proteinase